MLNGQKFAHVANGREDLGEDEIGPKTRRGTYTLKTLMGHCHEKILGDDMLVKKGEERGKAYADGAE